MSWGVATQNGVSVSLASIVSLSCGATEFSPASLFTSGVAGAWYDPSDINNYMAGLGPEATSGAWLNGYTTTFDTFTSTGPSSFTSTTTGAKVPRVRVDLSIPAAGWYALQFTATFSGGSFTTSGPAQSGAPYSPTIGVTMPTTSGTPFTTYFYATGPFASFVLNWNATGASTLSVSGFSVKEVTTIANATLFQDSAGTTPVTAVEQPVGLMLDKSQGLAGTQQINDPSFDSGISGWGVQFPGADVTFAWNSTLKSMTVTRTGAGITGRPTYPISVVAGTWYKITFVTNAAGVTNAAAFSVSDAVGGTAISGLGPQSVSSQTTVKYGVATTTGTVYVGLWCNQSTSVDILSVEITAVAGNHASQATAASRPVLRARYNLLTYSEQFDNAVWSKRNVGTVTTVTSNTTTAPDGTLTADTIADVSASDYAQIDNGVSIAGIANTNYTFSVYVLKDAVTSRFPEFLLFDNVNNLGVCLQLNTSTGAVANRTVVGSPTYTTTIQDAGLWWRVIHTMRTGGTTTTLTSFIRPAMSSTLGGAVDSSITGSIVVWGAQLVTGSSAGTYQRIAAATDYATAGFLPYLALDGTDDSFGTNSIDFSATDKMSVCAGVTKLSDAAAGMLVELSATVAANNGSFYVAAPESTSQRYSVISRGSTAQNANQLALTTSNTYLSPVTNVLTGAFDISGDSNILRLNGTQINQATGDQGTGNYGNYPLYIGRRNNASIPLNGRIYQLVVCGKALSASELASTEAYVNSKTGAY